MSERAPRPNDVRNELVSRVGAGELTREQADQEAIRRGAGPIYYHPYAPERADKAKLVWKEALGDARPFSDADAKALGRSLDFLQSTTDADRLHTPKGAERAALAKLKRIEKGVEDLVDCLVERLPSGEGHPEVRLREDLALRLLSRNADVPKAVEALKELRAAARAPIDGYRQGTSLETIGESTAERLVHSLAGLFERFSGETATAPLSESRDPPWGFVRFVYASIKHFEISFAVREGKKVGRKSEPITPLVNQPVEVPGLSVNTISAALKGRNNRTRVIDRALDRLAKRAPDIKI